jgi:hypothetical protein
VSEEELGVVVVVSVSEVVVVDFLWWCFFFALELWSVGFELSVVLLVSVLLLIDPAAFGFFCESGFWPEFPFCLSVESGAAVCGCDAEGLLVSCDMVGDDVLWSVVLPDCARAIPVPSSMIEAAYTNLFISGSPES